MSTDDGPVLDPGGAMARLASWKGRIDQLAGDTKVMSDRLAALRVTVADGRRQVEVTVDSAGALVDLTLGRDVHELEPDELAALILRTVRRARATVADRAQEIITGTLGEDSPAAREIATRVREQMRAGAPADAGERPPGDPRGA